MMMAATANPATTTASLFFSYNYQRRPLAVVGLCRNPITTSIRRRISFIPKSSSSSSSSCCCIKIPQLAFFSPWTGLKPLLAFSRRNICTHKENKGRRHRGKVVYASLFGVGAPEALVIGVVALLVFGPKGLAEVARNLGKTLRAFQPTIRELQEVSRDFKSTLEREIGLDEVAPSTDYTYKPTSSANEGQETVVDPRHNQWQTSTDKGSYEFADGMPKTGAYTSEDLLKITQEQLAASAVGPQTQAANPKEQPQGSMANTPSELQPSTTQEATAEVTSSEKTDKER